MAKSLITALFLIFFVCACGTGGNQKQENKSANKDGMVEEELNLTQEWDKVFPQSDKVNHSKVTFHNR